MKPTVSVATIVKDRAAYMREFLGALVNNADEVIIVDTGSTDGTLDIIKEYECRYPDVIKSYRFASTGSFHYGIAKNVAISKATGDYVLILDSDEFPEEGFITKLRTFLNDIRPTVATLIRKDDRLAYFVETQVRIIKNGLGIFYNEGEEGRLHEALEYVGEPESFAGIVIHKQGAHHWLNDKAHVLAQMNLEIERTPKTKSFLGHLLRGVWAFQFKFRKVYFTRRLYRDGVAGLRFAWLKARYAFLVQYYVGLKPRP